MSETGKTADIDLIQRIIPHRYPFLLVDRVEEIEGTERAVGIKNVTANEPHFQGHFPDVPIMPGVLMVEAMAQTAAVMVGVAQDLADTNMLVYFMGDRRGEVPPQGRPRRRAAHGDHHEARRRQGLEVRRPRRRSRASWPARPSSPP